MQYLAATLTAWGGKPHNNYCRQFPFFYQTFANGQTSPAQNTRATLQWKCENLLGEKQPKFTETSTPPGRLIKI